MLASIRGMISLCRAVQRVRDYGSGPPATIPPADSRISKDILSSTKAAKSVLAAAMWPKLKSPLAIPAPDLLPWRAARFGRLIGRDRRSAVPPVLAR
jgi:hypothetical protein